MDILCYCYSLVKLVLKENISLVCFNFLTCRGAKIDMHDKDNFSPLLIAACNGHGSTIKLLLDKGAFLYALDKSDKTAIYWCAKENKVEALKV